GPGLVDAFSVVEQANAPVANLATAIAEQAAKTELATGATDQYGHAISTAGDAVESFTSKVDRLAQAGHSLFDSTTDVAQATADSVKSLKENGKTLDANTQKGRNNREALSQLGDTLVRAYDAYVQLNGEGEQSNAVMARNREAFIKAAEGAGKTKTEA